MGGGGGAAVEAAQLHGCVGTQIQCTVRWDTTVIVSHYGNHTQFFKQRLIIRVLTRY